MNPELAAALELDLRLYARAAQQVVTFPGGCAIRHRDLAIVHDLNGLRLGAPLPDGLGAAEIAALADRELAGLAHRQVVIDDAEAGERLAPALCGLGFERRRTEFMALRGDPADAPIDPRARELSEAELSALQLADFEEEDYGPHASPGLALQLVSAQAALRAATTASGFGAGEGPALHSMGTLFLDPDVAGRRVAMIDQVATLRAYRERGLAKAVVAAAIRAAGRWGAELIVIPADADDWPQLFYGRLGFAPLGRQMAFTRRELAAPDSGWGAV